MSTLILRFLSLAAVIASLTAFPARAEDDLFATSMDLLIGTPAERTAAAETLIQRNNPDMIPTLVLLMRIGGAHVETRRALQALAGQDIPTWRDAMHFQEAHPDITPHPTYYDLKLWYWGGIDKGFPTFFDTPIQPKDCLLYTSPSPRDRTRSRMPSSA